MWPFKRKRVQTIRLEEAWRGLSQACPWCDMTLRLKPKATGDGLVAAKCWHCGGRFTTYPAARPPPEPVR